MISIIVGTKGQIIKTFPIIWELDKRKISYQLIDGGQHVAIAEKLYDTFSLKNPDCKFYNFGKDITNVKQIAWWMLTNLLRVPKYKKTVFSAKGGLCLVHGDAPPALLGTVIAKLCGQRVVHIEAGERTYRLAHPFPEEAIRRFVDRVSYLMLASDENSYNNLVKEKQKGVIVNVGHNTVFDAVRIASEQKLPKRKEQYVLASIHRFETIKVKSRLLFVVDLLLEIAQTKKIVMPLHESTKEYLENFGLYDKLAHHVEIMPLQGYFEFVHLIANCAYMVTDGGGPQQETKILGTACLLLREATERPGYDNICLAGFNLDKARAFLADPSKYKTKPLTDFSSPSQRIVDILDEHRKL